MKTFITVKRPNGQIEEVEMTAKFNKITPAIFAKIVEGTRKAGRGEVQSYRNVEDAPAHQISADVLNARRELDAARNSRDHSPERIVKAEQAYRQALSNHPADAAELAKSDAFIKALLGQAASFVDENR